MEYRMYKSEEEFFEDLGKIKPCNLRDKETTIEDAVEFCKQIFTCFIKTGYIIPNRAKLESQLHKLGACAYNEADAKFISDEDQSPIDVISLNGDIQFPLMAFNQVLLSKDQQSFSRSYIKIASGERSWAGEWIENQNEKTKEFVDPVDARDVTDIKQVGVEKGQND